MNDHQVDPNAPAGSLTINKAMTTEDEQLLNDTHLYVQSLLNEAHITDSSELDDAARANAQTSKDIELMISVLLVHKKYREGNVPPAPTGMFGLQKPVAGAEALSISETIAALKQLKARMKN